MFKYIIVLILGVIFTGYAQENFPVNDVRDLRSERYLFKNATIYIDYQTKIDNGQMMVENGRVKAIGQTVANVPKDAVVVNLKGRWIYPSFIDMYTHYGLPPAPKPAGFNWGAAEQIVSKTSGAYNANQAIKASYEAAKTFDLFTKEGKKTAANIRKIGFGHVVAFNPDGIARGTGVLASLTAYGTTNSAILKTHVANFFALKKGSSTQTYPISVMGAIALLRQTYYDARWYKKTGFKEFKDLDLEAFNKYYSLPKICEAKTWLDILRLDGVGDEFGEQYIIKSNGSAYQRIDEIKKANVALIVPLTFPKPPAVENFLEAENVDYSVLKHWEEAPKNAAILAKNGIPFTFTASGLKKPDLFWKHLRRAIEAGLSKQDALKALTHTPAKLLKVDDQIGSLKMDRWASFVVTSGDIFEKKTKILSHWIKGKNHVVIRPAQLRSGLYDLQIGNQKFELKIDNKIDKVEANVKHDTLKVKAKLQEIGNQISLNFKIDSKMYHLSGWTVKGKIKGIGETFQWTATYKNSLPAKPPKDKPKKTPTSKLIIYPFTAFGYTKTPDVQYILFKNATVWTNEKEGILKTDVLIKDGKILKIGKNLKAAKAKVIDATGRHLTSGIIDEHSHIALTNVNDVATISAMCRMSDAVDPTDIDIYRQLAGGVTASQLLHGSANPVGGQSAIIKMRWGASPSEILIKNADKFIKFALGENVKRSRNSRSIRYPQTRMGVEQVYRDIFSRAVEYDKAWKAYKNEQGLPEPRRDLVLETIAEIVNQERFITCHSYVQSEINMLMKVAEDFNFKINTFTHILEGYKVADKIAKHGAGGSTFSDWWAYKMEVQHAIPYNASLMTQAKVVTAINSDDAEMGRRLNQEAAKSVKYGNLSEEEAWKLVTLNPAKLLHLDDKMGSIKIGKDADLVLWSDNPLSIYAKVEQTLIDGRVYYDRADSEKLQKDIMQDSKRIITKILNQKQNGNSKPKPKKEKKHCETLEMY